MMRIGIDIDDTITDTYPVYLSLISVYYGLDYNKLLKNKPSYKELHKTLPDYDKFIKDCFHLMAKMAPLKKNVVEILNKLKEKGCEIVIITARNQEEYTTPYKISYDYLTKNNVPFDKMIIGAKDKGLQCVSEGIDVFIDDNVGNCRAVRDKGIKTIRFDSGFKERDNSLINVKSWNEVYEVLFGE